MRGGGADGVMPIWRNLTGSRASRGGRVRKKFHSFVYKSSVQISTGFEKERIEDKFCFNLE